MILSATTYSLSSAVPPFSLCFAFPLPLISIICLLFTPFQITLSPDWRLLHYPALPNDPFHKNTAANANQLSMSDPVLVQHYRPTELPLFHPSCAGSQRFLTSRTVTPSIHRPWSLFYGNNGFMAQPPPVTVKWTENGGIQVCPFTNQ